MHCCGSSAWTTHTIPTHARARASAGATSPQPMYPEVQSTHAAHYQPSQLKLQSEKYRDLLAACERCTLLFICTAHGQANTNRGQAATNTLSIQPQALTMLVSVCSRCISLAPARRHTNSSIMLLLPLLLLLLLPQLLLLQPIPLHLEPQNI